MPVPPVGLEPTTIVDMPSPGRTPGCIPLLVVAEGGEGPLDAERGRRVPSEILEGGITHSPDSASGGCPRKLMEGATRNSYVGEQVAR